ncbi:hypothetical protein PFISCL1PPCAC_7089, partial [Pristionchus fissidentatus]
MGFVRRMLLYERSTVGSERYEEGYGRDTVGSKFVLLEHVLDLGDGIDCSVDVSEHVIEVGGPCSHIFDVEVGLQCGNVSTEFVVGLRRVKERVELLPRRALLTHEHEKLH